MNEYEYLVEKHSFEVLIVNFKEKFKTYANFMYVLIIR